MAYHYNSYGALVKQVDANGTTTTNSYDFKGRKIAQAVSIAGAADEGHLLRWDYDLAANGLGQVGRETKGTLSGDVEFTQQTAFDRFGRAYLTTSTFAGAGSSEQTTVVQVIGFTSAKKVRRFTCCCVVVINPRR